MSSESSSETELKSTLTEAGAELPLVRQEKGFGPYVRLGGAMQPLHLAHLTLIASGGMH